MSLIASDAVEVSGSTTDPAPLLSADPSDTKVGMDTKLFCILSKGVEELGLEWSTLEDLDEWFLPGRRQAFRRRARLISREVGPLAPGRMQKTS